MRLPPTVFTGPGPLGCALAAEIADGIEKAVGADLPYSCLRFGPGTIRDHSRRAVLVAHGADKAEAARRLVTAGGYDPDWPATIVCDCARPALYLDESAARANT